MNKSGINVKLIGKCTYNHCETEMDASSGLTVTELDKKFTSECES